MAHKEIGDDDSRGLFAAALEYDLASFHQRVTQPTPKPKPKRPAPEPAAEEDNALAELARTAQSLIDRLAQLDDDAKRCLAQVLRETDRFKRSYGEDYLESLRCELARLATAGKPASTPAPAPVDTPPPEPSLPEAAGVFILRAADVFQECFEQEPTAVRGAPFVAAVKAIAEATGIAIPTELGTLSRILKQG